MARRRFANAFIDGGGVQEGIGVNANAPKPAAWRRNESVPKGRAWVSYAVADVFFDGGRVQEKKRTSQTHPSPPLGGGMNTVPKGRAWAFLVGQRHFDALPMNPVTRRVSEGITVSHFLAYASGYYAVPKWRCLTKRL